MSFSERTGDMFAADDLDALAHGVNTVGIMGGIAGKFENEYPEMAEHYKGLCNRGEFKAGQVFPWQEKGKPMVYNLATQEKPGADAQYKYVKKTMKNMLGHANSIGIKKIGIPQIGCGIGGLEWDKTKNIIQNVAKSSPVEVVAFSYEPPKPSFKSYAFYDQDNDWWSDNDSDWYNK